MTDTAALLKLTVPVSSDQGATSQGILMPKLKYRFRVRVTNFGIATGESAEFTKQVMDFKRPTVKFDPIVLDVYNSRINLAGKPTWGETTINIRDDSTNQVANLVGQQLQKQFDFYEQSSAAAGIDYKFTLICEVLDGGNGAHEVVVLETWELYGCFLESVDYGGMEYKTSEAMSLALTIKFDNAFNTSNDGQIGEVGVGYTTTRPSPSAGLATGTSQT